jgi:hypothetical protein
MIMPSASGNNKSAAYGSGKFDVGTYGGGGYTPLDTNNLFNPDGSVKQVDFSNYPGTSTAYKANPLPKLNHINNVATNNIGVNQNDFTLDENEWFAQNGGGGAEGYSDGIDLDFSKDTVDNSSILNQGNSLTQSSVPQQNMSPDEQAWLNQNDVDNGLDVSGQGDAWSWFGGRNKEGNKTNSMVGTGVNLGSKMFGAWTGYRAMREAEKAGKFTRAATRTQIANMAQDANTSRDFKYQDAYSGMNSGAQAGYETPAQQAQRNKLSGTVNA